MTPDRESLGRVGLVVLALVAHAALTSCGGSAMDRARSTTAIAATALAAADGVASGIIAQRFEDADTLEELETEERRAERIVRAFVSAHVALLAVDASIDAAEAAKSSGALDAVACALPAIMALADALDAYGAERAGELVRSAVGALSIIVGGECPARGP